MGRCQAIITNPADPQQKGQNMKYFVMRKFKYIRGFQHDMPDSELCKNGFDDLTTAEGAKAALELLEHRPDMISFIIVQEVK